VLILALDTTTRAGSCALWRDGIVLDERPGRTDRTHAERLPGELADLLDAHGLQPGDVDLYAVASGPGSFTGMRVGIATIQALALVHQRLVVPVTALEALGQCGARRAAAGGVTEGAAEGAIVGAWMEAYRGEVFGALYRVRGARASSQAGGEAGAGLFDLEEIVGPTVAAPATLAAEWEALVASDAGSNPDEDQSGPHQASGSPSHSLRSANPAGDANFPSARAVPSLTIIGDGVPASEAVLRAQWPDARLVDTVPLAAVIAELAAASPDRAVRPHAIVPVYVRRPDAELVRDRQQTRAGEPASCDPR
jgi:tRNA threonylcarbamoyl adenosine modification protein YeaZ